jgi:hypothetical protein
MYADWQAAARLMISKIDADLASTATLAERRSALRKAAGSFHCGTSHGKKTWSKHARKYLERHGQPPRQPKTVEEAPNFGPDIIFPFRS